MMPSLNLRCAWERSWGIPWWWALFSLFSAYLIFWPSFDCVWLMDDFPVIIDNPDVRSLANFWRDSYPGRPLRELSFLLDYQFFGLQSAGYHLQQIFWHALNAFLVLQIGLKVGFSRASVLFAACLFLIHPIQVEVLANISHRKDSLSLAFCLLAFVAWLNWRSGNVRRPLSWLLLAGVSWALALSAKQNAVVFPAILLIWEAGRLTLKFRRLLAGLLAFGFIGLVSGRLVWLAADKIFQTEIGPALVKLGIWGHQDFASYLQVACKAWSVMLVHLVWPVSLGMEYAVSLPSGWLDPWVVAGLAWPGVLLAGCVWSLWSGRKSAPIWGWLLFFWLPTSNLLGFYSYFVADRYWYAPSVGLFLLLAIVINQVAKTPIRISLLFGLCFLLFIPLTWKQQKIWGDELSFYGHMLKINPGSQEGLVGMAETLIKRGETSRGREYLQRALGRQVNDGRIATNLGHLEYGKGNFEGALAFYERALAGRRVRKIDLFADIGSALERLGRYDEAIEYFNKVIELNPSYERVYTNLGMVFEAQGDFTKAAESHRKALELRPDYGRAHYNLGVVLYRMGDKTSAFMEFDRARELLVDDGSALYNYASVGVEIGRPEEALAVLPQLLKVNPALGQALREEIQAQRDDEAGKGD